MSRGRALLALVAKIKSYECQDGEVLIYPGQEVSKFYMIKRGFIKIMDKYNNYLPCLDEGSFFGEFNMLFQLKSSFFYSCPRKVERCHN